MPEVTSDPEVPSVLNEVTQDCLEPKPQARPSFVAIVAKLKRVTAKLGKTAEQPAEEAPVAGGGGGARSAVAAGSTPEAAADRMVNLGVATGEAAYRSTYANAPSVYGRPLPWHAVH